MTGSKAKDYCERCGIEIVKKGPNHKYCSKCKDEVTFELAAKRRADNLAKKRLCGCGCGKIAKSRRKYTEACAIRVKKEKQNMYQRNKYKKSQKEEESSSVKKDNAGNYICCGVKMDRIGTSLTYDCNVCDNPYSSIEGSFKAKDVCGGEYSEYRKYGILHST